MLRTLSVVGALLPSECAFHTQVQRFGVEYNEALASMANEQALLNILRARYGTPTHFSSVNRFTGTLAMKATGGFSGTLHASGLTRTTTTGSTTSVATTVGSGTAPTGPTTNNSVVSTPGTAAQLVDAATSGASTYMPQIGGELDSGTTVDVQVYDQQKFYQGITSAVPFGTVEMLFNQGFEPELIASLLIARVYFYREHPAKQGKRIGDAVASYRNEASDRPRSSI